MAIHLDADKWSSTTFYRFFVVTLFLFIGVTTPSKAQCTLICTADLQTSLPASGQYTIPVSLVSPTAASLCPGALELTTWNASGQVLPNNTITCAQVDEVVQVRVKDIASGNSCISEITVMDMLPPVLFCPQKYVQCTQATTPSSIGTPSIIDNCTPYNALNITRFDIPTTLPCGTIQNGQKVVEKIDRTWLATDASGNISTCLERIWIKAPVMDSVIFPVNKDDISAPSLSCGQNPLDLTLTGQPLLYGVPINNSGPCKLGLTSTDQPITGCSPGSYTILRNWILVDYCTGQVRQSMQIIKITDQIAPQIQAPATLSFNTDAAVCSATVLLPNVVTSDFCSAVTVVPNWQYGSGFGPFSGVAVGDHTLTWLATDACGNTQTATTIVRVKDNVAPNVVCVASLVVSVGSSGQVLVNASSLNAGSWDNCGPIFLTVTRNEINWASFVTLTCADENQPVALNLRVTDTGGSFNDCVVTVTARDFTKPTLSCPPAVTLTCLQDPTDLVLTGQATATDNCTLQSITHIDIDTLSGCSTGILTRRWTATDQVGNTRTCDQTITLIPISTISVAFPANVTLSSCLDAINVLPSATGSPNISGISCYPLIATYTDEVFDITAPACFSIYRSWKVIDHCIYNPNSGTQGIWEYIQEIHVTDNTAPVLTIPDDITVSSDPMTCGVYIELSPATAEDCSSSIAISNIGPNGLGGTNASGWYAPGTHNIVFTASDGCGNYAQKTLKIVVQDLLAPTAVCINGLSVNIGAGGAAILSPTLFNGNSTDNCSPQDSLTFSIFPPSFTCQLVGQQQVTLTVTDKAGNSAQCQTFINVQDNQGFCAQRKIDGYIRTPLGLPVFGVTVRDGQGHTVKTDSTGYYLFNNLLPGKDYTIKPEKLSNWTNGISPYDFVLISRHILNLEPMDTPEKIIAADPNISNTVSTFDIVQMRKVLLGTLPEVPNGKSWRFIPSTHVFVNPDNPFVPAFDEEIKIINLESDRTGVNFKAIKSGDINGDVNPLSIN